MKQFFKMLSLLSAVFIMLSASVIPAFAKDPPPNTDGDPQTVTNGDGDDEGTIIGEIQILDTEEVLGEGGDPQTSDTDLQTYVPAKVKLDIGSNGSVKHNKKVYSKNASFETMTLIFYIMPQKGYMIDYVLWNGKDVTKLVSKGLLKIEDLEDGTLTVRFKAVPPDEPNKNENSDRQSGDGSGKGIHHVKTSDSREQKALTYISVSAICLIGIAATSTKKKEMRYLRKK